MLNRKTRKSLVLTQTTFSRHLIIVLLRHWLIINMFPQKIYTKCKCSGFKFKSGSPYFHKRGCVKHQRKSSKRQKKKINKQITKGLQLFQCLYLDCRDATCTTNVNLCWAPQCEFSLKVFQSRMLRKKMSRYKFRLINMQHQS